MNIATRSTGEERATMAKEIRQVRQQTGSICVNARSACKRYQQLSTTAGGLAALQVLLPDGTDAADLVDAFDACRTLATTLDPSLVIEDLS